MKNLFQIIIVFIACQCFCIKGECQVKKLGSTASNTSMIKALNGPSKKESNAQALRSAVSPSINGMNNGLVAGCHGDDCKTVNISYEVPGFVWLDRFLLASNIHNKIGNLLDLQQTWQSMPYASAQTKQQMNDLLQKQIDKLQSISDNLTYDCTPVNFQTYPTFVNADVRYNDPISGIMGLMMTNGNGDINVTDLFNGIPMNSLDASPVVGKLIIYNKK